MIICPICDRGIRQDEGLIIRPIDNGTTDIMRILHVDYRYSSPVVLPVVLHESDSYTRLRIDY